MLPKWYTKKSQTLELVWILILLGTKYMTFNIMVKDVVYGAWAAVFRLQLC